MKNKKLFLMPLMLITAIFLLGVAQAGVVTYLIYDDTAGYNLTINNGDSFGLTVVAESISESGMSVVVELLNSNGNLLATVRDTETTMDSYSDYSIFNQLLYSGPGNYSLKSTVVGLTTGQTDTETLTLEVLAPTPGNNPPVITLIPNAEMDEETNYNYQVVATDDDNDTLTYSLTQTPTWLSMDSNGLMTGTAPDVSSDSVYAITVKVSDSQDFDRQTFLILVRDLDSPDTTAPFITIISPVEGATYTSSNILFEITTNEDVSGAAFSVDGATIPTIMDGVSRNFTKIVTLTNGAHSVTFYALDFALNLGTSTTINFVVDTTGAGDTTAPIVTIISPTNNQTYNTKTITVDFTAVDLNLNTCYYSLNGAANITTPCNTPFTITAREGTNTVTVYANDNSGNVGNQTITFNVDTGRSSSRNNRARIISDSDGDEQYLSQFNPLTTTEEEEVLGVAKQPSSFGSLLTWLLVTGVLVLIVAMIIVWIRR